MRRTTWPLALAAAVAVCSAAAQAPGEGSNALASNAASALTFPLALDMARSTSRDIAAAQREVDAATAALDQAGALPNPQLELQQEGTRRHERETTVLLSQPIELGGKRAARTSVAELELQAARQRLVARTAQARATVTVAFFEALVAQERIQLVEASLALASSSSGAAARRVIEGKVSPIEQTRAKVAESTARLELAQAQTQLRTALAKLAGAIGNPAAGVSRVDGAVAPPAVPDVQTVRSMLANAPAQRQATLEAERQAALAQLARARRTPDVTVGLGAKRVDDSGRTQAVLALTVPLPIFDSGRAAHAEATHRAEQAAEEAAAAAMRLDTDAMQTLERLRSARLEVDALEQDVLPGAEDAYRAAARGFELGKFAFLEVLDAQRTVVQARAQRLRALAEAHAANAELQRLLGATFEAAR